MDLGFIHRRRLPQSTNLMGAGPSQHVGSILELRAWEHALRKILKIKAHNLEKSLHELLIFCL